MKGKVQKCHCLAMKASAGKLVDPNLFIDGQQIPFTSAPVKFLGQTFQIPHDISKVKQNISSHLMQMLNAVDTCLLTGGQKLKMFRAGVCPRLSWFFPSMSF